MPEYSLEHRYNIFLNTLQKELDRMFSAQAEFIKCKEGCSYCCERGEYPFSKTEFEYLLEGFKELDTETKLKVLENIALLNEQRAKSTEKPFMHTCPFLINHSCSVYNNRGLICRTFGLLCEHENGRLTMPFCQEYGLNYSSVYDEKVGQISDEKVNQCSTEPKAYRISRDNVMKLSIARNLDIEWGESKTILDYCNEYDLANM